jgi:hypothetical protein
MVGYCYYSAVLEHRQFLAKDMAMVELSNKCSSCCHAAVYAIVGYSCAYYRCNDCDQACEIISEFKDESRNDRLSPIRETINFSS